jgi:hypothetical protein
MKESAECIGREPLICQHRVYCGEVVLQRGTPARQLECLTAYRLEVFMRWEREAPGRSPGRIILNSPLTIPRSWLKGGSFLQGHVGSF